MKQIRPFFPADTIYKVGVPASKSVLNRALLLSAFSGKTVFLSAGDLNDDTEAMIRALNDGLNIRCERAENGILVHGIDPKIPNEPIKIDVGNAGTVARFLPIALAFLGGTYRFTSGEQMEARPMDVLPLLAREGVKFHYEKRENAFPFTMTSCGISADEIAVNTDVSTQFASGILLSAPLLKKPLTLILTGERTGGAYIAMTKGMLTEFGIEYTENGDSVTVFPALNAPTRYRVEADLSSACYFFALAFLRRCRILVKNVRRDGLQGDARFLDLLEKRGLRFTQTEEGLLADGRFVGEFEGFDVDMQDFSDQTPTAAALAPFAKTPSCLRNVAHIGRQESNRIQAIVENLTALGGKAESDGKDVVIHPSKLTGGKITTYNDHRIAMAFALIGTQTTGVVIDNESCSKKSFGEFFDILDELSTT